MKHDIILAGVGGQGILSIAALIGHAAMQAGLNIKQAEVHGMSQRGGEVQSHLRISSDTIHADLVPLGSADMVLSAEPLESLRYLPYLSPEGWLVTNTTPVTNMAGYPDLAVVGQEIDRVPHHIAIDADAVAKEAGNSRSTNVVMVGAASPFLAIEYAQLESAVRAIFARKGETVVAQNLAALAAGRAFAESHGKR